MKCNSIIEILSSLSPEEYALQWDNTGLQAGHADGEVKKILVTLDCDEAAIEEAIHSGADLIVSHHPLIFGGVKKISDDSLTGRRLLLLIENHIACYSMHTNFDIKGGMAELAAGLLSMENPQVLEPQGNGEGLGRWAVFPKDTLAGWVKRVKAVFGLPFVTVFGELDREVSRVAVAPGSGKEAAFVAAELGLDLIITGDVGHHTGTDVNALGCAVIDAGHYGIEHIFVRFIGDYIKAHVPGVEVVEMPKRMPYVIV